MVRVLSLVSYTFLPAKVGGQKGIALFNKYFSRHTDLHVVTTKTNDNGRAEGYATIPLFSGSPLRYVNPLQYFRIRKIIRGLRPSHLLIEHPYLGWLAVLLKKTMGLKLVVHSHNIESLRFKTLGKWWWGILWHYEKWTHQNADYNLFITEEDRQTALRDYALDAEKCTLLTYGIERAGRPSEEEQAQARTTVRRQHGLKAEERLLLFAGAFNYGPNLAALQIIEHEIAPRLQQQGFPFRVLVCGPGLDGKSPGHPKVAYAGFVDDIYQYFMATDVFLNPLTEGGGIKTKLVESLGMNANAVSTNNGAIGVDPALCNGKLQVAGDGDWQAFAEAVVAMASVQKDIGPEYYGHFYWGYSTQKAAEFICR
ncbi:glycosyltransferase [Paraflavisolibacter sp. H34]|uniref:glycosyltransferase n=1 Tax=Huijunlia imazamoxiresistens TaxID=3127457 RepID=UPI003017AEBB